jgi:hypothetical protein
VAKKGVPPSEPLEGYFEKGVWARARAFAQADATVDATAALRGRDAAAREVNVLKWTAIRSKRDRTLERTMYTRPRRTPSPRPCPRPPPLPLLRVPLTQRC